MNSTMEIRGTVTPGATTKRKMEELLELVEEMNDAALSKFFRANHSEIVKTRALRLDNQNNTTPLGGVTYYNLQVQTNESGSKTVAGVLLSERCDDLLDKNPSALKMTVIEGLRNSFHQSADGQSQMCRIDP